MNDDVRPVPGHPLYSVSRDGRVFSHRRGTRELKQMGGSGLKGRPGIYRYVNLGKACRIGVHQLVAMCFLPPPIEVDGKMQNVVRHRDNDPTNNHADNLRWGTQKQNLADREEAGTLTRGEVNGQAKVTEAVVLEIRRRRAAGEQCRDIAIDLRLSHQEGLIWLCGIVEKRFPGKSDL
jgi:hypothetical protein